MRVITWNVERGGKPDVQTKRLMGCQPDLIALQEIRATTAPKWCEALKGNGFAVEESARLLGDHTHCLLIAAAPGWSLKRLRTSRVEIPFPALFLSVIATPPAGESFELHNTHVPNGSSYGWRKVEHFEALYRYLVRPADEGRQRILCGDFNSPAAERNDGTVLTVAQKPGGKLRTHHGQRWDAAERSVIRGLEPFGLKDAFRTHHGYARAGSKDELSYFAGNGVGRRFDHVFSPPAWTVESATYLGAWREGGLSDHSPLEVVLVPG